MNIPSPSNAITFIKHQWQRHSLWRLSVSIALMLWLTVALALLAVYQFSIQPLVNSKHQLITQHVEQLRTATDLNVSLNVEQWLEDSLYDDKNMLTVIRTPDGVVHGSLSHIPQTLPDCPNVTPFPILRAGSDSISVLEGCRFTVNEHQILIATNNAYIRQIQDNFVNAALSVMIVSFFIALIPGWIVKRKITQQLTAIHKVINDIEQGYFDRRIPLCPTKPEQAQDEWERIGLFVNKMLDEVESSVNQIQGVTDAIAHDLRTPLTRIKNRLTIAEEQNDAIQKAQTLTQLHHEFDEILITFNAMLELSKLEALRDTRHFDKVNITAVAQDVTELIEPVLEDKQQTLTLSTSPSHRFGERSLLFRLIYNLVDNAHKYSPQGAHIHVDVSSDSIVVSDNGPGIPPELRTKVFQRLYRVDKSRNTPGHGLGLALVATVVKLHGASIELDYSDPQKKTGLKVCVLFSNHSN
ncbi:sensor histidine kinase [Vibrio astriarenae]|nr:HAMP domain-containing sensor histidine kinase [Vibrio astriarenae]